MKHTDIPVTLRVTRREYNGRPYAAFTLLYKGREYNIALTRGRTQLRRELVKEIDIDLTYWEECNPDEV